MVIIASCGDQRRHETTLRQVQGFINEAPDSALLILDNLRSDVELMDKATHMRWELLHAQAQNKAYIPFTSDSMMKEVVAYYDRHGSPADRMTAHYLLGSVYRDMGEIPASLQSFQNAVACADTTDRNCDFRQLAKVYVQMGTLFNNQYLPSEAIDCFGNGVHYALLALDTLLALHIQEQSLLSY
jgi:hypothetical protein